MKRPKNLKVGDMFRVIEGNNNFNVGDIISLKEDDGTNWPYFWNENKSNWYCIHFYKLEPHAKTIRDAQVGDVVFYKDIGYEHMVLERLQNTVILSNGNDFKFAHDVYTFDELEEDFTLKNEPVVVSDKTAEAIKLLKEAGYKITKE